MKYDVSQYTPLERELLRQHLNEESIEFELSEGILVVDDSSEDLVDAALVMVEQIGNAIAEEIALEEQALRGDSGSRRCENCGQTPAAQINLRREVGMVLVGSTINLSAVLCDRCADALTKEMQKQTAIKGWTSPASLVMNPFVIAGNARSRRKHRRELGK
jgi:hypothetical protein